jgi:MerR family transcriptional regulator, light-induced transcriptional regulator
MDGSEEPSPHGLVQIGDLARRVGVRVDTLRAWERRYGLLNPHRSTGGFRLYSSDDEAIVRAMVSEIDRGYPPSQAAKLALARAGSPVDRRDGIAAALDPSATTPPTDMTHLAAIRAELYRALIRFDGGPAHQLLDELFAEFTLNAVLRDVLLPCLQQIGEGWAAGEVSIAEEHFTSQLIRERLLGLARDWDQGRGPRALLACPTGERHDIGLICFGLVLSRSGWRIIFLGPDTPVTALAEAVAALSPDLIVLTATLEERFTSITEPMRALAADADLVLAGPGATHDVARATGTTLLEDAPVPAALRIAARPPRAVHRGTEKGKR